MAGLDMDDPGGASLAALLRAWRRRALLTQEQLGERTGLSVRTIRRLESDGLRRPHIASVRLLAGGLNLTDAERTLLMNAASDGSHRSPPSVLRQLPADVAGFTGRVEQLRALDALLTGSGPAMAVVISAIGGTAGIGKSSLAVHWAHRVAQQFPDGQLYLNLRGFAPGNAPTEPAAAVRHLLDALAEPAHRIPADTEAQVARYRSIMSARRILVVLDNARNAAQVRPLLPNAPGCLTVVTSRSQLTGLVAADGAHPLTLDLMSTVEAHDLLVARLGVNRMTAEPAAVDEIITLCGRLPLALAVVAARAAYRPQQSLADLAAAMRDARARLDAFDTRDPATDVRTVYSWSYTQLSPDAARLFRLLSLHPGPDISAAAAANLAGIPPRQVEPLLAELVHAHMIGEDGVGRFALHDLLRAFATEQAHTEDTEGQRHLATGRMLDHYLHTAYAADRLLNPHRTPIALNPPAPATTPEHLTGYEQAMAWLTAEHHALLAAVQLAATGWDTHTWQLASTLATFLHRRGHRHDRAAVQRVAVAAADRLKDPAAQAHAHNSVAGAYLWLGRYDDADTHLRQAIEHATRASDHNMLADTHIVFAYLRGQQDRHNEAIAHARQALALCQATSHHNGQASALGAIGWHHSQLGDHQQALTHCQQALTLYQKLGDPDGQANTWDSLGHAHHHLGQHHQAITCYLHALNLVQTLGDRYYEATTLTRLGNLHHTTGSPDNARTAWQQALTILDELDHPDADPVRAKLATPDNP